ncbi:MAG: hypothetical protein RR248_04470 [Clostridia bacterium]
MDEDQQKKQPYKGVLIIVAVACGIPIVLFFILYGLFLACQPQVSVELNFYQAMCFAGAVGTLFVLAFMFSGGFNEAFKVVVYRVKEFFSDIFISPSMAFKWYGYNIKRDGVVFWIYIACVGLNLFYGIYGLVNFLKLYNVVVALA